MKKLLIEVQEDTLIQANNVLENLGLDIESAIRMFLKRVAREQSVSFVLNNTSSTATATQSTANVPSLQINTEKIDRGEMSKSFAIKIFKARRNIIDRNVTYSSKNRSTYNYWSNPNFSVLQEDWTLILNDWVNRKLYLFKIPRNSIYASQLVPRNDQKNMIDIQIFENDPNFTDKRSGFSFRRFLVDKVDY